MRALVLADQSRTNKRLVLALRQMGIVLDHVGSVEQSLEALAHSGTDYDLAVTSLDSSGDDAANLIRELKCKNPVSRVLAIAAQNSFDTVKQAIESGADDFILLPINFDELKVRIDALFARSNQTEVATIEYGPLVVDMATRQAWLDGTQVNLTPRERGVLLTLLRQRGKPVSKQHIASRLFSINDEVAPSAVEIYVHRLRRKIEHADLKIKTERGLGYALQDARSEDKDKEGKA